MSAHEFTADQIVAGIQRALKHRDLDVIPGLIHLLAVQDPGRAQAVLDGIEIAKTVRGSM